jgi:hypothetical protein
MAPGLHEHFDEAARRELPVDLLRVLKQVDRRQLLRPKED